MKIKLIISLSNILLITGLNDIEKVVEFRDTLMDILINFRDMPLDNQKLISDNYEAISHGLYTFAKLFYKTFDDDSEKNFLSEIIKFATAILTRKAFDPKCLTSFMILISEITSHISRRFNFMMNRHCIIDIINEAKKNKSLEDTAKCLRKKLGNI